MDLLRILAFVLAYPIAVMVIVRWTAVVRERRWRWLLEHHVALAMIAAGWATAGVVGLAALHAVWFVVAGIWYTVGGRQGRAATA